jgi:hypothetical protein
MEGERHSRWVHGAWSRIKFYSNLKQLRQSLETFMVDLSLEVTKVLQRYTDTLMYVASFLPISSTYAQNRATATTNTQFATQSQSIVSHVSPEREVLAAHQLIPEHISRVLPKRTLYQNYTYGDSLDLIFGFSLLDYAAARNLEDGAVPGLVAKAVQAVDERGKYAKARFSAMY